MPTPTVSITPLNIPPTHPFVLVIHLNQGIRQMRRHDPGCVSYGLHLLYADLIEQWLGENALLPAEGLYDAEVAELERWQLQ